MFECITKIEINIRMNSRICLICYSVSLLYQNFSETYFYQNFIRILKVLSHHHHLQKLKSFFCQKQLKTSILQSIQVHWFNDCVKHKKEQRGQFLLCIASSEQIHALKFERLNCTELKLSTIHCKTFRNINTKEFSFIFSKIGGKEEFIRGYVTFLYTLGIAGFAEFFSPV